MLFCFEDQSFTILVSRLLYLECDFHEVLGGNASDLSRLAIDNVLTLIIIIVN